MSGVEAGTLMARPGMLCFAKARQKPEILKPLGIKVIQNK
jgi:hypothetical protein